MSRTEPERSEPAPSPAERRRPWLGLCGRAVHVCAFVAIQPHQFNRVGYELQPHTPCFWYVPPLLFGALLTLAPLCVARTRLPPTF